MRTTTQILPGVKAIGWVDSQHLPRRVDLLGICLVSIPILTDIHPIPFFGESECKCQRKKSTAGYEDTATLKFHTDKELPHGIPLAFVITDVNDCSFLIGSREVPHPTIECEHRTGTPNGDAAGFLYEVKHIALKSLIPCDV